MLSRLELDGLGSPADIARRIHELAPDLPLNFTIEYVCRQLDIESIEERSLISLEAMLLMDENKAWGAIVLADGRRRERQRFSIAHELGHFLIPIHRATLETAFLAQLPICGWETHATMIAASGSKPKPTVSRHTYSCHPDAFDRR